MPYGPLVPEWLACRGCKITLPNTCAKNLPFLKLSGCRRRIRSQSEGEGRKQVLPLYADVRDKLNFVGN